MTAYSSTLNLRMKDLYDKNYYTPQLPMRTFRNPYFLPTSNQLLFDILKKQSTTSVTATPPTSTSSSIPTGTSVPPSTTGPTRPAATAAKPKQTKEEAEIQDRFNKLVAKQKAGKAGVAVKVFSPPPTFIPNEALNSKLARMEAWKASQPASMPTTDQQGVDLMRGNRLLEKLRNDKSDLKYKPLRTMPTFLGTAKSALAKTIKNEPHHNPSKSDDHQSAIHIRWQRDKENLEDIIKKLSAKGGAASKPIEKAGKQGDTTKLTDAAAGAVTKPRFEAGNVPKSSSYPKLGRLQLKSLAGLYQSWNTDQKALTDVQSASPKVIMSVKEKAKYILKKKKAINEYKKQIVALENKGR
tara:strand:+ start:98 stop:1159 length:1062 start_codon:yes stop_codon:yes gene_type:complete